MRSRVLQMIALPLATLTAAGIHATEVPVAVSPGDASKLVVVESRCPTFSWAGGEEAKSYELVVYRVGAGGEEAEVVLRQSLPARAYSWTPSLDSCLERGGQYAWSVRAAGSEEVSDWSAPSLFAVSAGPTAEQFQEALEVVRTYLAAQGGAIPSTEGAAEVEGEAEADSELTEKAAAPEPRAASPTALKVDQGIEAASFTGDGSALTNLSASNLASGTVAEARGGTGIDSSGTASGSLLYTSATGTWAILPPGIDGEVLKLAAGTPSWGTDSVGGAHAHVEKDITDLTHTVDTVLTEGQVETFVTNGPLDGSGFTNLSGDNVGMGTVAESRIADEIARDAEVVALIAAERACPGIVGSDAGRYIDPCDGTVRDNNTGLIWLKDASCADLAGTDTEGAGTWATAQAAAAALADGTCGLTDGSSAGDWRQPTIWEWCSRGEVPGPCPTANASDSLVNTNFSYPAVSNAQGDAQWSEGDAFVGVQNNPPAYWSATEFDTEDAWQVKLGDGFVLNVNKVGINYVWPVRDP